MTLKHSEMVKLEAFLRALVNLTIFNLETILKFDGFESMPYTRVRSYDKEI